MRTATRSSLNFFLAALMFACACLCTPGAAAGQSPVAGVPDDWSHHRLIFSNPGTADQASAAGRYAEWSRVVNDPRYKIQQAKRSGLAQQQARTLLPGIRTQNAALMDAPSIPQAWHAPWRAGNRTVRDATWLTLAFVGLFAAALLSRRRFASALALALSTATVLALASCTSTGTSVGASGLENDWHQAMLTGAVMPNTYPAKYTFNTLGTPDCTNDFVVYPTGSAGSGSAATIVAYNNVYTTTCSTGTVPNVYWAYNTAVTTDAVTTSPILSLDGTKVAFVEGTGTSATLVVLKWAASTTETVSSPDSPTVTSDISGCTAPCMTQTALSGATTGDSYSSPFYDYVNDVAYVGDNAGNLYQISGVFNSTSAPTVSTLTGLSASALASPVYDPVSGCVFVGDNQRYLYSVASGFAGTVCTGASFASFGHSEQLGKGSAGQGFFDAPLVDSTAGTVYGFVTESGSLGHGCTTSNCVVEYGVGTIASGSTSAVPVINRGIGSTSVAYQALYAGDFDNVYYTSSTSSTPSGDLWVVGNTNGVATLYQIAINSGVMSAAVPSSTAIGSGASGAFASPVTEFCNNGSSACTSSGGVTTAGTDTIYFSAYSSNIGGCTASAGNGCVLAYDVTTPTSPMESGAFGLTTPGTNGCFTTGGFVVDNSSASTGASQIYFIRFNGNSPSTAFSPCTTGTGNTLYAVQAAQQTLAGP